PPTPPSPTSPLFPYTTLFRSPRPSTTKPPRAPSRPDKKPQRIHSQARQSTSRFDRDAFLAGRKLRPHGSQQRRVLSHPALCRTESRAGGISNRSERLSLVQRWGGQEAARGPGGPPYSDRDPGAIERSKSEPWKILRVGEPLVPQHADGDRFTQAHRFRVI